jgi:hypothetical protein
MSLCSSQPTHSKNLSILLFLGARDGCNSRFINSTCGIPLGTSRSLPNKNLFALPPCWCNVFHFPVSNGGQSSSPVGEQYKNHGMYRSLAQGFRQKLSALAMTKYLHRLSAILYNWSNFRYFWRAEEEIGRQIVSTISFISRG